MKTILISFVLLFSCSLVNSSWAQVACTCQPVVYLTPDPANPCCYLLNIDFTNSPGCGAGTNFTEITINTNVAGGTGTFTGATSLMVPFTATVNSPTLVTFSTLPGFIPATPQNYVVGQVCFANGSPAFFPAIMTISNGPNDNCAVDSFQDDLTTICTMTPPCTCQPVVNLTADMSDPCCYFIDVNFPNPAACNFPTDFDQITLMTTGTGIITGAVGSSPFSATTTSTLATFSTSPGIPPLSQLVGQICFANYTTAPFQVQLVISNSALSPDPCAKSFSFPVTTPCPAPCEDIFVADQTVCSTDESLLIPLIGCSNVASCVTQVNWYVRSPCTGPWTLFQVKPDCSDLVLVPKKFTNDICVYAEVLTDGTCNCPLLISNVGTIYLCDPVGCSIQNNNPDFCTCGNPTPITVFPSLSNPNCPYTVVWYDDQGTAVGNSPTYTPPTLCFQGLPTDCYQDYLYKAVIDSPCGKDSCFTTFRVYNDNAPKGSLVMLPAEAQPFCPGEDATLQFTPGCAGDPKMWDWYVRPCVGGSPTYLGNAGKMNPLYLTNKLYQSVYYYVETQNGLVCPMDTVQLKIEVKEPPSIISFSAVPDPCVEQQVLLSLDFAPCTIAGCTGALCNCTYSVDWYKDGFVVGTSNGVPPVATFTYFGPPPLSGNYYAVLKDDCCPGDTIQSPLIMVEPTCVPIIKGPCFMCNGVPVTLEGEMILPPRFPCPTISTCNFEWYELIGAVEVNQNNQTQLFIATHPGAYIFESNCNGCLRRDTFYLPGCNNPCSCGTLQWAEFWQEWSFNTPIDSTIVVTAPCPKVGKDYLIHGVFSCMQASCGNNVVDWVLNRPGALPPVTGTTNIAVYPHFDVFLPWADCVQPGVYTLTITRHCGVVPCAYTFTFEVPPCGCLCSDLPADGGLGFGIFSNGVNCIRSFKPYALDPCDVVTWTVNGTLATGSSIGNSAFNFNFSTLGSGTYTVCMQVTRTQINGTSCTYTKCRTIVINCGGPYSGLCTIGNVTKNGNFTDGLVSGHLGDGGGEVADWMVLPEVTDGLVFVDDSAGGYDDGYLVLSGGQGDPAGIFQAVDLTQELYTNIEYNFQNLSGIEVPSGTRLEFSLYSDPDGTDQALIYTDTIVATDDTGWVARSVSVENMVDPVAFPYLVVSLTNDDSGVRSVIGLDNLEVCNSSSPLGTNNEPSSDLVFHLFPNPANNEITIEWDGFDVKRGSAQIVGSLGQLLRKIPIQDGSTILTTSVADLPEGIYFVKILSGRRTLKVLKFIKL